MTNTNNEIAAQSIAESQTMRVIEFDEIKSSCDNDIMDLASVCSASAPTRPPPVTEDIPADPRQPKIVGASNEEMKLSSEPAKTLERSPKDERTSITKMVAMTAALIFVSLSLYRVYLMYNEYCKHKQMETRIDNDIKELRDRSRKSHIQPTTESGPTTRSGGGNEADDDDSQRQPNTKQARAAMPQEATSVPLSSPPEVDFESEHAVDEATKIPVSDLHIEETKIPVAVVGDEHDNRQDTTDDDGMHQGDPDPAEHEALAFLTEDATRSDPIVLLCDDVEHVQLPTLPSDLNQFIASSDVDDHVSVEWLASHLGSMDEINKINKINNSKLSSVEITEVEGSSEEAEIDSTHQSEPTHIASPIRHTRRNRSTKAEHVPTRRSTRQRKNNPRIQ